MKTLSRQLKHAVVVLAFVVGLLITGQMHVNAAVTAPTGLKQTEASSSYVKISWNAVIQNDVKTYYRISSDPSFQSCKSERSFDTYELIGSLSAGTTYYVQVGTSETNSYSAAPSDTVWSSTLEVVTAPEEIDSKTCRQTEAAVSSFSLTWEAVSGATSYKVVYAKDSESIESGATFVTNTNSAAISNLANDTIYRVEVYPIRTSTSGFSAVATSASRNRYKVLPSKIKDVDNTVFYTYVNTANFEWKGSYSADGYQYYVYNSSNKKIYSGETAATSTSVSSSKLKKPQFYRIKVRGYVTLANNTTAYGSWSDTLYFAKPLNRIVNAKKSSGNIKVSWGKVSGATNYTVYISTKKNSGFKKVKTLTKKSLTVKKYGKSKLKSGKTYYIRVAANKKAGKITYKNTDFDKNYTISVRM